VRKGQKTIKKEKERAIICGGMGLRLVSMCYFVVLLVTVCCYTNKQNLWHFDPTSNDFVERLSSFLFGNNGPRDCTTQNSKDSHEAKNVVVKSWG